MNLENNWKANSQMATDHWGAPKNEPTTSDLASEESFKEYLMAAYGWNDDQAREELKWFSDFSRTFESN